MTRLRLFIASLINWTTLRYAMAGVFVTLFNIGMPVLLNSAFGIPLEACIPVSFAIATTIQFTLQRLFVFRHVVEFALTLRRQALWYVVITAIQYPTAALATAFLPSLLHVDERIVYVVTVLAVALLTFLFLRRNVFHARESADATLGSTVAAEKSAILR